MWPVLLLLIWCGVPLADSQCERSSAVRFTVSSYKNQTGHRLVAVEMRSHVSLEDAVCLSVDQWTERCGPAGTVTLSVTASTAGPSSATTTPDSTTVVPSCQVATTSVPTAEIPVTTRPTPRPDYRHLPGLGYYKLHSKRITWDEGRRTCESEGAHLAIPDSREELEALYNLFGCCPWIGVHRQDPSSPWMTVLGQPLNPGFKIWDAGKHSGSVNCTYLYSSDGLANSACTNYDRFICELKL